MKVSVSVLLRGAFWTVGGFAAGKPYGSWRTSF